MLKAFIVERCQVSPDFRVTKMDFYESYSQWERSRGRKPLYKNEVGRQMKDLDFKEGRTKNTRFWTGVQILDAQTGSKIQSDSQPAHPLIKTDSPACKDEDKDDLELNCPVAPDSSVRLNHEDVLNEMIKRDLIGVWEIQKF